MTMQAQDMSAERTLVRGEGAARVLIVDDDITVLSALERLLCRDGHHVYKAQGGKEAIQILRRETFAVILCDQRMPDVDGVEVLKEAVALQPDAVRIVLTGFSDMTTVINSINVGHISQYITKPWDEPVLLQTVRTSIEKYRLVKENQILQQSLAAKHVELAKAHQSLQHDLKLGARIHEVLLTGKAPVDASSLSIDVMTVPSQGIDGDFYDFYRPSADMLDIVIGDVMGKGLPAALVGAALKIQLARFAIPMRRMHVHDRSSGWHEPVLMPNEIVGRVSTEIAPQLVQLGIFSTLFYGRFDFSKNILSYIDCGSAKPLHYSTAAGKTKLLVGDSFPIGIIDTDKYTLHSIPLETGDLLVFYSDGVTDIKNADGDLYGLQRLVNNVESNSTLSATDLLTIIKKDCLSFAGKPYFDDDLTLIVVKVNSQQPPQHAVKSITIKSSLAYLQEVREFVDMCCHQGLGDVTALSAPLQLAMNEAFCNIVLHGYEELADHDVIITGEATSEGVVLEILEQGRPFDPASVEEPDWKGRKDHGYGWYIIKQMSDQVVYVPKADPTGWNRTRIFKRYTKNKEPMNLSHTTQQGILVITLPTKTLDAQEAPIMKQKIFDLIDTQNQRHVVFDLRQVEFVDSSGLGSFLSVLRALNARGGDLKLAHMNNTVRTLFEMVRMHKLFEIFNTTEEAVRSFVR